MKPLVLLALVVGGWAYHAHAATVTGNVARVTGVTAVHSLTITPRTELSRIDDTGYLGLAVTLKTDAQGNFATNLVTGRYYFQFERLAQPITVTVPPGDGTYNFLDLTTNVPIFYYTHPAPARISTHVRPGEGVSITTNAAGMPHEWLTISATGGGGGVPDLGALAESYLWVRPSGDDTTGQRGRPDKPFQTIRAAQTNAIPGDVIWVLPGWYEEYGLGRDFLTYALHSQAIIGPPTGEQFVFAITNATVAVFGGTITNNINTNTTSWLIYGTNATFSADNLTVFGRMRFVGTNSVSLKNCNLLTTADWLSVSPTSTSNFTDIHVWGGRSQTISEHHTTNSARIVGMMLLDSP